MIRIGVDTGGTFTDLVRIDDHGIATCKVLSTPHNPAEAILTGIRQLLDPASDAEIVHGTTVATNAILERKGARLGLIATAGFEDVLIIGRQTRRELYNFRVEGTEPLAPRELTFGVQERITADGSIAEPLDESALANIITRLRHSGAESIALCFLHSYANPAHERRAAHLLRAAGFTVSASHEILPEYREYERWSTTAINAYITPLMVRYLQSLEERLGGKRLNVMQSNGGSLSAASAKSAAVHTVLSGPAAGVVGARFVAGHSGFERIITFDMGGTSTDVCLIDRDVATTTESHISNLPVRIPVIDIHTVGAGGGSIAYLDGGKSLRVGPRSAGAVPGPACYGTGSELTVTDANLLLGRLHPDHFFGGRMKLDVNRARRTASGLASQLSISETELAAGVVRIANANMARAIRVVSVERGFDPRDFALLAFGGAGGMHACDLAAILDMRTVLVPRHCGVLSALGALAADYVKIYSQTVLRPGFEASHAELDRVLAGLASRAREELRAEGFSEEDITIDPFLDVRYSGQSYEIMTRFSAQFAEEFHNLHERRYGYANRARAVEVVNVRVQATGRIARPKLPSRASTAALPAPVSRYPALFGGSPRETLLYLRRDLCPGMTGSGPAVIAGDESTTVVTPDFRFAVDENDTLILTRQGAHAH